MDSSYLVAGLLEKLSNADSDIRFMALTDIGSELSKDSFSMTEHVERKVTAAVLKALDDKNGEVQNLAVKTLVPLVRKAREVQVREIVDHLCSLLGQDRDDLKDVASIGAKSVVLELSPASVVGRAMVKRMLPTLVSLLQRNDVAQLDVIDILSECLSRFGKMLADPGEAALSAQIQAELLALLEHSRPAIRKRTTAAIGNLVVHVPDTSFDELVQAISTSLAEKAEAEDYDRLRTYIGCVAVLSRFSSRRLGKHLENLTSSVFEYSRFDDDELKENCFQTLESFVVRCPAEVTPFLGKIISLALEYIKYDPNYDDGEEEEEDMDVDGDDEEDDGEEDEDEEDYSDADDVSWKVRRTSAKLLASIISTRSDLISEFFSELAPTLITRFKEREESVRVEVFQSFIALIRQVGAASGASISHSKKENWRNASHTSLEADPRVHLQEQIPKICKYLPKQLSGKSVSTRQTGYVLLRELVVILQGGLDEKLGLFVPTIEASLLSNSPVASVKVINNPNLKIEVLQFLQAVLSTHSPSTLEAFLPRLVKSTVAATQEKFYKITSEALLVLIELIKTVRPIPDGAVSVAPASPQSVSTIQDIYKVVLSTAKMTDVDLEVKERSIMALATLLSQAGELLTKLQVEEEALALLADRLRSEVTRLVALRAIKSVTDSVLVLTGSLKLGDFPSELLPTVGSFLRKSQRSLRMASLAALESMIRQAPTIDRGVLEEVFTEIKGLLTTEPDVHVFPLAINVVSAALAAESIRPAAVELARRDMLPTVIQLTFESPQLVGLGVGLDGVRQFWSDLAAADPNIFDSAVSAVTSPLLSNPASVAKQSYRPLAESIAVLAIAVPTLSAGTVNDFVERIAKGVQGDVALLNMSLLVVGNIGRHSDISATYSSLDQNLIALFAAQQEEIKLAAAFALGNVAVGNLARHVPLLLSQMREGGKKRYLVLMALKEVIARSPGGALAAHAAELWELLFSSAQDTTMEESTRSVVAECLAKLLVLDPASRLAPLQKQLDSPSAEVRATVVSAIRHTLTDQSAGEDFDTLLAPSIVDFLRIDDSELNVRQTSLATLNSAAHNKPYLIRSGLTQLLPRLYQETVVKQELIHVVEMGPFKHRVDDGMEARKSAFECMYTLLEKCLARIELSAYVDRVLAGLSDPAQDIKELNHLVLQRLARVAPAALTARLDEAAGPLREAVDAKPKSNAVKQEIEKVMELVRSGVRTVLVLARALGLAAASAAASAPASAAAAAATIPTSPAGGGGVAAASDAATAAAAPLFEELLRSVRTPGGPIYDVYAAVASDLDAQAAQAGGRFVG